MTPTPDQIKAARKSAGLTQTQAAALVSATRRGWQGWEAPAGADGARAMPAAVWELFNIKAGQLTHKTCPACGRGD